MRSGQLKSKSNWQKALLICLFLLAIKAILLPPIDIQLRSEEPRRAVVSMEMILSDHYLVPHLNNWPYYNKPPIFNWIMASVMNLADSFEEWTVRIPGQLSFLVTTLLIFLITKPLIGSQKALWAACFFLSGGEILFYGIIIAGQIDLFYTLIVFLHIFALFLSLTKSNDKGSNIYLIISYLLMSIGFLTKGLPSLAFQGLTIVGWSIFSRDVKLLIRPGHFVGIMISAVMIGGYFYQYDVVTGEGWTYLVNLYKEAAQKSGLEGQISKVFSNAVAFPLNFIKTLLPWSVLLVLIYRRSVRDRLAEQTLYRFILVFLASNILLYWFANRLALRYIYPFLPFFSILLTGMIDGETDRKIRNTLSHILVILLACATLFWIIGPIFPQFDTLPFGIWQITWSFIFLAMGLLFFYKSTDRWIVMTLMILMLKIQSTWAYYPLRLEDEKKNGLIAHVEPMFAASKGQTIFLYGSPEQFKSDASLGPLKMGVVTFEAPMPVSYQHLYHITKRQHTVMKFDTVMSPNQYYLARESDVKEMNVDISYQFEDDWLHHQLVICKLKE